MSDDILITNQTAEKVQLIWAELLDVPSSSIVESSDFFELGGNSMLMLMLQMMLTRDFSAEFTAEEVLSNPKFADLLLALNSKIGVDA